MKGRLNLFQATMLRWRALYPYNAVHVVHVRRPLHRAELIASIHGQLADFGMTGLRLGARQRTYEWTGGPATAEIRFIAATDDALTQLDGEIERQLNTAFAADGSIDPFRFFAIDCADSFYLGLAYDHFVAGGDSIVQLLHAIIYRRIDGKRTPAPQLYPATYRALFARQAWPFLKGLTSLPGLAQGCRRAFRPRYAAATDGYNAYTHFLVDPAQQARLDRVATAWGVSRNDLWLAVLLKTIAPLAPQRRSEPRRKVLAVASIVNVRRDMGAAGDNAFAPMLASFRVGHAVADNIGMRELARAVHGQTNRIKTGKIYLQTLLALGIVAQEWRFLSEAQRHRFFAKHYPVVAGLTSLNVDMLWTPATHEGQATLEYVRGVATGPLAPMILALTNAGGAVVVGIAFRTTVYQRETVAMVVVAMQECIRDLGL
ncbi:MAG: hypothetical protein ABI537_03300 [Casimicrobiaceae bacterium]